MQMCTAYNQNIDLQERLLLNQSKSELKTLIIIGNSWRTSALADKCH